MPLDYGSTASIQLIFSTGHCSMRRLTKAISNNELPSYKGFSLIGGVLLSTAWALVQSFSTAFPIFCRHHLNLKMHHFGSELKWMYKAMVAHNEVWQGEQQSTPFVHSSVVHEHCQEKTGRTLLRHWLLCPFLSESRLQIETLTNFDYHQPKIKDVAFW